MKTNKVVKSKAKAVKKVEKTIAKAAAKQVKAVKKTENKALKKAAKNVKALKKTERKVVAAAKKAVKKTEKKIISAAKKTTGKIVQTVDKAAKEINKKAGVVKNAASAVSSKVMPKEQNSDKLTPQEIKEIEKHLLEMREEVQNRIKSKKEHEMPETEVGDEADVASQSLDKEVLFELNGNAQALLDQIESALRRISKGIYGTCEYCRCQIPKKRILALPFARYCIRCQSSNEGIKR